MAQGKRRSIPAIWAEFGRTRSERLRNALMEHYLPVVRHIAQRVHTKLPREVELDDLVSAGLFGLMDAIAAFDPKRKVRFETYCAGRVRGAILDELRSWDWVPRLARLRAQKLLAASQELKLQLGREPTTEELAGRLRVPSAELERIIRDGSLVKVLPLMHSPKKQQAEEQSAGELLEDRRQVDQPGWMEREDLKQILANELTRAEQLIILLYYYEEMTMKEIGLTLDLSESRVSQMHSSILARLQSRCREYLGVRQPKAA